MQKRNTIPNQQMIWIKNIQDNNLIYQSPESIDLFVETVYFYMALEKLNVPYDEW